MLVQSGAMRRVWGGGAGGKAVKPAETWEYEPIAAWHLRRGAGPGGAGARGIGVFGAGGCNGAKLLGGRGIRVGGEPPGELGGADAAMQGAGGDGSGEDYLEQGLLAASGAGGGALDQHGGGDVHFRVVRRSIARRSSELYPVALRCVYLAGTFEQLRGSGGAGYRDAGAAGDGAGMGGTGIFRRGGWLPGIECVAGAAAFAAGPGGEVRKVRV